MNGIVLFFSGKDYSNNITILLFKMSGPKSQSYVLLTLALIVFNSIPAMAEDWDGIQCYAGFEAKPTTCKSCVTVYNDYEILKRDCYESLGPSDVQACESNNNIKCHHCNETFCNEGHPKHKCIECDSKSDANCKSNTTQIEMEQCIYDSNDLDDFYCFTKYNATTGDNERGCVSTASLYSDCMHNKETCELCIADGTIACNGNEFPENRRKCVYCDTLTRTCPTQQNPKSVDQLSVYCQNVTDTCAIINRGDSNNTLQMCASELDDTTKSYCNNNQGRCVFCMGENNCNLLYSDGSSAKTTTTTPTWPITSAPTEDPSNNTENEVTTQQPSNGNHEIYSNRILLAVTFMAISRMMA